MRIIRLLLLVLVLAGTLFGFQTYRQGGVAALQNLPNQILGTAKIQDMLKIDTNQIQDLAQNPGHELQTLAERGKEVGEHAGKILGDSIEVNEEAPPIHERALEYGRYLYCQQVVEDYERQ